MVDARLLRSITRSIWAGESPSSGDRLPQRTPSLVGSISNQTPYDIEGCRLLADGAGGVEIGRVPRGGSVDLAQRFWQQGPFTYQHFAGLLKGDDAVPRIQRAIFESLGQQGPGESTRLIGSIWQPLFGLTVDGRPPERRTST